MTNITKQQAREALKNLKRMAGVARSGYSDVVRRFIEQSTEPVESSVLARQGVGSDAEWRDIETAPRDKTTTETDEKASAALVGAGAPDNWSVDNAGPSVGLPTFYVRHPDDTYSVADPQPVPFDKGGR